VRATFLALLIGGVALADPANDLRREWPSIDGCRFTVVESDVPVAAALRALRLSDSDEATADRALTIEPEGDRHLQIAARREGARFFVSVTSRQRAEPIAGEARHDALPEAIVEALLAFRREVHRPVAHVALVVRTDGLDEAQRTVAAAVADCATKLASPLARPISVDGVRTRLAFPIRLMRESERDALLRLARLVVAELAPAHKCSTAGTPLAARRPSTTVEKGAVVVRFQ
jgi:hypothetical protein